MRQNRLSIHSENILPIIKKWLYSSHDIFLRELVSNACDAIKKLRVLQDCGQAPADDQPFEIHIRIDAKNKTLTISDNGIGMTEDEVEKYIAQIAFSGAEDFLAKYKTQSEKDPMIGHFGLGFYSSYMVAGKVELKRFPICPSRKPVKWSCDGSSTYEIGEGSRTERGTDIILHLDEASAEYLEAGKNPRTVESLLLFHARSDLFKWPDHRQSIPALDQTALRMHRSGLFGVLSKTISDGSGSHFLDSPQCRLSIPSAGNSLFSQRQRHIDQTTHSIRLFCNRVFVSDHCRDFLPDYLTLLRGAIDSPDIPLNVSRSYLQVDQNVRQLERPYFEKSIRSPQQPV